MAIPKKHVGAVLGPRWIGVRKTLTDLDVTLKVNNDRECDSIFEVGLQSNRIYLVLRLRLRNVV